MILHPPQFDEVKIKLIERIVISVHVQFIIRISSYHFQCPVSGS